MKKQYKILIASIVVLLIAIGLLLIKNINSHKKTVYNPDEVVELGEIQYKTYDLIIDHIWTLDEYQQYVTEIVIVAEFVDDKPVECIVGCKRITEDI